MTDADRRPQRPPEESTHRVCCAFPEGRVPRAESRSEVHDAGETWNGPNRSCVDSVARLFARSRTGKPMVARALPRAVPVDLM
mgnify:CR=1 FL=1